jgi:hypothetical protein
MVRRPEPETPQLPALHGRSAVDARARPDDRRDHFRARLDRGSLRGAGELPQRLPRPRPRRSTKPTTAVAAPTSGLASRPRCEASGGRGFGTSAPRDSSAATSSVRSLHDPGAALSASAPAGRRIAHRRSSQRPSAMTFKVRIASALNRTRPPKSEAPKHFIAVYLDGHRPTLRGRLDRHRKPARPSFHPRGLPTRRRWVAVLLRALHGHPGAASRMLPFSAMCSSTATRRIPGHRRRPRR